MLFLILLFGCGTSQPEPVILTRDFYSWTCKDYSDISEVVVTTNTCEDSESGLHWLVAETFLVDASSYQQRMTKTDGWDESCVYEAAFPLFDEFCVHLEGVAVTAFVDSATWGGVLNE